MAEESRSRIRDRNTSFFHKKIKQRINHNSITKLVDDQGLVHSGVEEVGAHAVAYYSTLFSAGTTSTYDKELLGELCETKLNPFQTQLLSSLPTRADIKDAFLFMNPNKAPGPDGYNSFFFKATWHILGRDIEEALLGFFRCNKLLRQFNNTCISLIPKIPNPTSIQDFSAISCCNVLYKAISKILANKLKLILPHIIHDSQSGFLRGRSISDNIMIAHEVMNSYYTNKGPPRLAVKIDLFKAFNTFNWEFLWDIMELKGFPNGFIQ